VRGRESGNEGRDIRAMGERKIRKTLKLKINSI
jgi:hypothetical protein